MQMWGLPDKNIRTIFKLYSMFKKYVETHNYDTDQDGTCWNENYVLSTKKKIVDGISSWQDITEEKISEFEVMAI